MIIYIIEAYEMDGRSYVWGDAAYPSKEAAKKLLKS